ncbi:Glycosyl transferase family 2 [Litoreibacter ascidiaceicola]|uniref:Glycosyl transferase family 2 n=1 Tax=Litoreibacter ascidiaceicola TaxID=1486859 RepID=A0A1M4VVP6_9RHOB|nr:Glycosyl transferase family 2 [Litoreibacter ascidiaceicola]
MALVAIAANEAAHIAQFIYHHLQMGFSPICIITNNCTDATPAIVDAIASGQRGVMRLNGDAFPTKPKERFFQRDAYSRTLSMLERRFGKAGYGMFLDIDEFWVPLNGTVSIQDYIDSQERPDLIAFNWVLPFTDARTFTLPLGGPVDAVCAMHIKSVWRRDLPRTGLNPHHITSSAIKTQIAASGFPLDDDCNMTTGRPPTPGSAAVIHQMFRSQPEYLAALARGRPIDTLPFKTNRPGYRSTMVASTAAPLKLAHSLMEPWAEGFEAFVEKHKLAEAIQTGRRAVLDRARTALKIYNSMAPDEKATFQTVFQDVDEPRVLADIEFAKSAGLLDGIFKTVRPTPPNPLED